MHKFQSAIVATLLLSTNMTAFAEPQVTNQEEARRCSTTVDDKARLKCFDDLFSTRRDEPKPVGTARSPSNWSIIEGDLSDDVAQFSAGVVVGDAALILRCREKKTEAAFSTKDTFLGDKAVGVRFRIDQREPVKEVWRASMNGYAAFAPNPVDFIRELPEQGRVFIRAVAADGNNKDANFLISGVSAMRNKIARACSWSDTPDEPVGTTAPPKHNDEVGE
jgi:hypothetical protein